VFAHLATHGLTGSEQRPRRPIQRRGRPKGSKTKRTAAVAAAAGRAGRRKAGSGR
jgi:hypothetical protein